jgi:hypothetical protein
MASFFNTAIGQHLLRLDNCCPQFLNILRYIPIRVMFKVILIHVHSLEREYKRQYFTI